MAASLSAIATAQNSETFDPTPSNVTIRLGGGFAIEGSLSDYSSSFFGGGLDFGIGKGFFANSETFVSLDALWASRKSTNASFFPFAINQRFYADGHGSDHGKYTDQHRAYGFLGLGATYYEIGGADTKLSLRGGFGVDINENFVFETTAFLAQRSKNDVSANAVAFYIGYRFH